MAAEIELEQEVASVMAFALHKAGDPHPYYWDVPEDFKRPAMYFPQPEIDTGGDTLGTYASEYAWYINVFADSGKNLRPKDPGLKRGDTGVAQLTIGWTSRRSYADDEPPKVKITQILFSKKEDSPNVE